MLCKGDNQKGPIGNHMPDDGGLVDLMFDFCPDENMRRKLLVDNPARLYDFTSSTA